MKNMSYIEERNRELEARCSAMTKKGLPKKSKDLGSFNQKTLFTMPYWIWGQA